MAIKIAVSDTVEIILSHNECGYEEVLDTLPDADWVDVVTYNLSAYEDDLQKRLQHLVKPVQVRVVTNIPSRFPSYFSRKAKGKFAEALGNYRALLDPAKFKADMSAFFNISSHTKIVMTDLLAYIGSSNFSTESADKFECGVLFRDQAIIARIRSEIVDHLVEVSAPRDLSAIGEAKLFVRNIGEELKKLVREMKEGVYGPIDDFGNVQKRFRWEDAEVPTELLEQILAFLDGIEADFDDYYEHHHLTFLAEQLDRKELDDIRNLIEDADSPLVRLSEWDDSEETERRLQEYLPRATEENLDAYVSAAQSDADDKKQELLREAFDAFRRIGALAVAYLNRLNTVLAELQKLEKSKWGVDNT